MSRLISMAPGWPERDQARLYSPAKPCFLPSLRSPGPISKDGYMSQRCADRLVWWGARHTGMRICRRGVVQAKGQNLCEC